MTRSAAASITTDIRNEFDAIRDELQHLLSSDVSVDQARELLVEHAPKLVIARARLLLDSLLNYLMEDAANALANASTGAKNNFYALGLRERVKEEAFPLEPPSLRLGLDPRAVAGGLAAGGAAAAGCLVVGLVLTGLLSRIAGGLSTIIVSVAAFRAAQGATVDMARKRLAEDTLEYVVRAEREVASWLASGEGAFVSAFKEFQRTRTDSDSEMG